jgi:hypothetical protein
MPVSVYDCKCGKSVTRLEGNVIKDETPLVCECGSTDLTKQMGSGTYSVGYDYSNPHERAMALANKRDIEANAEKYLSGERLFVQPKGLPAEYAPQIPDHLRKRYI